ncbi:MAG: ChuX/HutX family heme-like substrate-binding protein [Rhizobiaceae bacterium]
MVREAQVTPEEVRRARLENSKMRERDLAAKLGISEGEFVAAFCGEGATRISADVNALLPELTSLGEVMALTRNESAVHEKVGVYDNVHTGNRASMVLSGDIDLRIFPSNWVHGFAVEKPDGEETRRSLQFFDASGDAVHKIHLRPASDIDAYRRLVDRFRSSDQTPRIGAIEPRNDAADEGQANAVRDEVLRTELRGRWEGMTDVHQFFGILRALDLKRHQALDMIGDDLAWRVDCNTVGAMLTHAAANSTPIMCFVGNHGCIQIHSGPVANIKTMGPWINVMDPGFHLHLRLDHIVNVWAVRKPNSDGHVTSVEAYNDKNRMIIQFFGQRAEGRRERDDWRELAERLPRIPSHTAA